jgi:protein-S-isoprenylcysteine O-methyltransferase Ste14
MSSTTSSSHKAAGPLARALVAIYGAVSYALGLGAVAALFLFLADWLSPFTVDRGPAASPAEAIGIDLLLIALFGVQHTVMARPTFKRWWTRFIPAAIERSTYLLFTVALFALFFTQWRPIDAIVWDLEAPIARGLVWSLYGLGWVVVLTSTFLIDHFELMGLRQTLPFFGRQRDTLHTPLFYRLVRHPMMTGWIITFWATPTMTAGHLLLAVGLTGYILVALYFEERTLVARFGERYERYRRQVPLLLPTGKSLPASEASDLSDVPVPESASS